MADGVIIYFRKLQLMASFYCLLVITLHIIQWYTEFLIHVKHKKMLPNAFHSLCFPMQL